MKYTGGQNFYESRHRHRRPDIMRNQELRNSLTVLRVLTSERSNSSHSTIVVHILPHRSRNIYMLPKIEAATISLRLLPSSLTSLYFRHSLIALINISKSDSGPFESVLIFETIALQGICYISASNCWQKPWEKPRDKRFHRWEWSADNTSVDFDVGPDGSARVINL